MTTQDLERRLADLLRERAEEAMEKTSTEEQLRSLLDEGRHDLRRRRRLMVAGGVVATAAAVAAAVWISGTGAERTTPEPTTRTDPVSVSVASDFLEATYAYDLDTSEDMMSPDVELVGDSLEGRRSGLAWNQAIGTSLAEHSCREESTSSAGAEVRCTYSLNSMGSEELGRGPYDGTVDLTIRDDEITRVEDNFPFVENGFSDEMWTPFAAWVKVNHPHDVGLMYDDLGQTGPRSGPRSLRLWEKHVDQYVGEAFGPG
jgi:hypothetical protein